MSFFAQVGRHATQPVSALQRDTARRYRMQNVYRTTEPLDQHGPALYVTLSPVAKAHLDELRQTLAAGRVKA
ncbi:MAG: hypothetical protein WBQ60_07660 [Asticcacaulis sp.]